MRCDAILKVNSKFSIAIVRHWPLEEEDSSALCGEMTSSATLNSGEFPGNAKSHKQTTTIHLPVIRIWNAAPKAAIVQHGAEQAYIQAVPHY